MDINEVFIIRRANILFLSTGELLDLSKNVIKLSVKNDYIFNKMPLFTITFKTTEEIYEMIRDDDVVLDLMVTVCDLSVDSEEISMDKDIIINDRIVIYEKPYVFTNRYDDEDNPAIGTIGDSVPEQTFELSGTLEKSMGFNKLVVNDVYRNTSPISALVHLLYKYGIGEVKLDDGFNTRTHKDILIPPMSPLLTPNYLQEYYGIFDVAINTYIDVMNRVFVYDPANIRNVENTFHIKVTSKNTGNRVDNVRPKEINGNVNIIDDDYPAFESGGQVHKHQLGTKSTFFMYDSMYNILSREYNNDDTFDKIRFFWNPDGSVNSEKSFFDELKTSAGIEYILTNINPYRISPYTQLIVSSDDEMVSGKYNFSEMSYTLIPSDNDKARYLSAMVYMRMFKKE